MNKLKIFPKLLLSFFLVAFLSITAFSVLFYIHQKNALLERTSAQLQSVNILKKSMIEARLLDDEKFMWHFIRKVMLGTEKNSSPQIEFHRHKDFLLDFCRDYGHLDVLLLDKSEKVVDNLYESEVHDLGKDSLHFSFIRVFLIDNSEYRLALLTSTHYLEKLLFENTGMGTTGESYLVDSNYQLLSKSRFYPMQSPQKIKAYPAAVSTALKGQTGFLQTKDYRNQNVLSAFTPVVHPQLKWALLSEMDESEAMQPVLQLRARIILLSILILLFVLVIAFYLSQSLAWPIKEVSGMMDTISHGIIPERIGPPYSDNETGTMKQALNRLIESFGKITAFAKEVGGGNLNASFSALSDKDELGQSLLHMKDQLKAYQEKEKNLSKQKALLLLEGQEKERRRVARDLHDGLGQWLTALKMKIASIEMVPEKKEELKTMASETIDEVRRITNNLMPSVLVDFGLDAAVRQLITNIQKSSSVELTYHYQKYDYPVPVPFEITVTFYRIAQEAANNILKHAQASTIFVELTEESTFISLLIQDNGKGFDRALITRGGNGLLNMEERVQLLNGKFVLESTAKGTVIKATVPV